MIMMMMITKSLLRYKPQKLGKIKLNRELAVLSFFPSYKSNGALDREALESKLKTAC